MIAEAQSGRSIAAEIENKGIVRAFEVYSGPTELPGDDDIIQRITADREIDADAGMKCPIKNLPPATPGISPIQLETSSRRSPP